jgi:hypothetical protein
VIVEPPCGKIARPLVLSRRPPVTSRVPQAPILTFVNTRGMLW